jgi:hypothetical protein
MDPGNWPRIWKLGGMAFPGHSAAEDYVKEWQEYRPESTPYQFGWGYGADLGGLSEQPGTDADGGGITYPFTSMDGTVTFDRQKTGDRTFDYNTDGVAHYGLYADWFADLRRIGGDALVKDMWNGSEAYLEMWERAEGIPTPGCAASDDGTIGAGGHGALQLGRSWDALLKAAGQPQQRDRAWSYCVAGDGNEGRADVAELTTGGTVELVGSTAHGRSAGGIAVGSPEGTLAGTTAASDTVRYVTTSEGTWAYATRDGSVVAVATAAPALAQDPAALAAAVDRLAAATATQTTAPFEAGATQAAQQAAGEQPTGQPLVGAGDAQLTAALSALCHLQISVPG